jgi:hypothetical protein
VSDYNLTGLSTRSFEQLVQALAAKLIGPNIVIFGDGPDGAREATWEGRIPYPNQADAWQGYGVVQAKFLQRPVSTTKDGQWVLQQLSGELKKFAQKKRKLRKPEYYIFATNAVLSAVSDRGFKDKVISLLRSYQKQLGLKDFDVWDYDKIRAFIDNNRDVAISYSAWVTSGDVLAEILKSIQVNHANFDQVLTNFLQKELTGDQFANLEQAGHVTENQVPLSAVFTDLPAYERRLYEPEAEPDPLPPGFVSEVLAASQVKFDPDSQTVGANASKGGVGKDTRTGKYVLIGGPGQGKTTLGQFVCQLFRVALLVDRPRLSGDAKRAIAQIRAECLADKTQLPTARRFPVRVVLSDFAKALATEQPNGVTSLLSYITKRISRRTDQNVNVLAFRQWMAHYPWLLVLDGLDEVPASSNRDQVMTAIRDFWVDATECNADILVIATTRPQGYSNEFSPEFYLHKYLAPLSERRALRYAKKLTRVRYAADEDRQKKIYSRLRRATTESATARLMRSPLQVTIMATLVDKLGQPPQERWGLFKEYYKVIYDREVERPIPAANILRQYRSDIDAIHYQTGFLLQLESERTGQTDAKLKSARFGQLVRAHLKEEGHGGAELESLAAQIIGAAAQRLVFLVGVEADQVGFEIRSLQEFMAAEGLMQGGDHAVRERLRSIAPLVNWRPVFLFAAGKCYVDRKHLRDTIHSICADLNESQSGVELSIAHAGSQLAVDLLEDGSARSQPKHYQSLARLACRLLDLPADEIHVRLASMYTTELDTIYREEISRQLANFDPFRRRAAWLCVLQLATLEVAWAKELVLDVSNDEDLNAIIKVCRHLRPSEEIFPTLRRAIGRVVPSFDHLHFLTWRRPLSQILGHAPWGQAVGHILNLGFGQTEAAVSLSLDDGTKAFAGVIWPMDPNWLKGIHTIPNPIDPWNIYITSEDFMSNPSPKSLAVALKKIADQFHEVNNFHAIPWPIRVCLSACDSESKVRIVAAAAERGDLGNREDWIAAERRWKTGVPLSELFSSQGQELPLSPQIATKGFPISALFTVSLGAVSHAGLTKVIEELRFISDPEGRSSAAYWLLDSIPPSGTGPITLPTGILTQMMESPIKGLWPFNLAVVNRFSIDEEAAILINQIGLRSSWLYTSEPITSDKWNQLRSFFSTDLPQIGILRVLAYGLPESGALHIPILERSAIRSLTPRFRSAAINLSLARGGSDVEDTEDLISMLLDKTGKSDEKRLFLTSALRVVTERIETERAIVIIVRLIESLANELGYLSDLVRALNAMVRKRRSNIADPYEWQALELNPSLRLIDVEGT